MAQSAVQSDNPEQVVVYIFISFFTEKCLVQTIQILTQAISVFPEKGTENAREILE